MCLQTDETDYVGNDAYMQLEDHEKDSVNSKYLTVITYGLKMKLKGRYVKLEKKVYSISQPDGVNKQQKLD